MKEMGRIYWCHSIGALGIFLAAIFVPVFLLKIGYSIREVFVFLLFQQLFSVILQYPVSKSFRYINPHYLMAVGRLSFAVFFWLLLTLQEQHWWLGLIALFWSINRTMYWTSLHYAFGLARAHKHSGRQIAKIGALSTIAATSAPALGGVIATIFGIGYTYTVAIALIFISVIPLLFAKDGPPKTKLEIKWPDVLKIRRDATSNAFNGMVVAAEQNIWPMFISLIVVSYAGIGILSSVIAIASAGVMIYVGRKEEVMGEQHYIKGGILTYGLTSAGRAVAQTGLQVFGLNLFAGIGRALYITPFMNRYYANSDASNRLGYITIMEASFGIGSSVYLISLLGLLAFFSTETVLAIGLGAIAILVIGVRLIR